MDLFNLTGIYLAPREIAARSPIAAEPVGRVLRETQREADAQASDDAEEDTFTLSERGRAAVAELEHLHAVQNDQASVEQRQEQPDSRRESAGQGVAELTPEEQRLVEELRRTDQEVRAHEQAHAAAGGNNVRYDYETGPDGKRYAVGGTTDIQVASVSDDPASQMAMARKLRAAAMAPADPSGQDLSVAAKAARIEADARMEA